MKRRQPFVLLILNCQKYAFKAQKQRETWLPQIPQDLVYYHVVGDPTLIGCDFVVDDDQHRLTVKTADDYVSLPQKVMQALEAVELTFDCDFVLKTDDDQQLVEPKFLETLQRLLRVKTPLSHYGGHVIDVKQPYLSEYHRIHPELPPHLPIHPTNYCNGRFYFLSRWAILDLLSKKEKIAHEYLEDYAIGYHLDPKYKENLLRLDNQRYFQDMSDFSTTTLL